MAFQDRLYIIFISAGHQAAEIIYNIGELKEAKRKAHTLFQFSLNFQAEISATQRQNLNYLMINLHFYFIHL